MGGTGGERARFDMLDALRGVAALVVLLHHVVPAMTGARLFRSGYLAVDFFFMLSGLVIANAWEDRLAAGASLRGFAASRLARVYPIMATGIALGFAVALANGAQLRWATMAAARQLLLWPTLDGSKGAFPLDGVEWSLMFELVANALYGLLLFRLPTVALAAIAAAAAVTLVIAADPILGIGLGDRPSNLDLGLPRVIASYTCGILLHRWLRSRGGFRRSVSRPLVLALTIAALVIPGLLGDLVGPQTVDPIVALIVFPALIVAACSVDAAPSWRAAGRIGAALSFPIYAIHIPVLELVVGPRVEGNGVNGATIVVALTVAGALMLTGDALPRSGRSDASPLPA